MNVPADIITKAKEVISTLESWPEDDWIGLSDEFDLNLYTADNYGYAAIYTVENGQTVTSRWLEINLDEVTNEV
jgi:hypothetical protein